jgi:mono/diheme cytochrome c family protein
MAEQTPDAPPAGSSTEQHMQAHFTDALLIRKAVIAGTPEKAARPAEALAQAEGLGDYPTSWRPFVERMQQVARRITDSTSASQAAGATADLGVTCGGCHQQRGGPKVSSTPLPPEGPALADRMQRHAWATERLWEGLIVPSSEAWSAGARALGESPFTPPMLTQGGVRARSAASDFAKLVVKAPSKKTVEERAALYAELLVVCGGCHRAINEDGT